VLANTIFEDAVEKNPRCYDAICLSARGRRHPLPRRGRFRGLLAHRSLPYSMVIWLANHCTLIVPVAFRTPLLEP